MGQNILVTGAAGYILLFIRSSYEHSGGSLVAEFISRKSGPIKEANSSAAVRSEEQAESLSKLGVNVIQIDLSDEASMAEALLHNESALTYLNYQTGELIFS
jgi:uncharacterized protein YbjT (DUF2867 family)